MQLDEIIQRILNGKKYKSYAEIGTSFGNTFCHTICEKKVAVEPRIMTLKYGDHTHVENNWFYRMTSDEFFKVYTDKIDLIFIDGLHEWEQGLKDIINAFKILNDGGMVLFHDTNPQNIVESLPNHIYWGDFLKANPGYQGSWCGDVWKTLLYFKTYKSDIEIYTLDIPFGLTWLRKGNTEKEYDLTLGQIRGLVYVFLEKNRKKLLNLITEKEALEKMGIN